jgi:hypothetical protein
LKPTAGLIDCFLKSIGLPFSDKYKASIGNKWKRVSQIIGALKIDLPPKSVTVFVLGFQYTVESE